MVNTAMIMVVCFIKAWQLEEPKQRIVSSYSYKRYRVEKVSRHVTYARVSKNAESPRKAVSFFIFIFV
jgi:hypothetical protein